MSRTLPKIHDEEDHIKPDVATKFRKFAERLETFCYKCNEELGTNNNISLDAELLFLFISDITDDVENLAGGSYD